MAEELVYTITPGRSGTAYLAELVARNVPDAAVFHERINFDSFGVHTPDISHLMLFNNLGNVDRVRDFWHVKLRADVEMEQRWYVETSHMLAKAGLLENLDLLESRGRKAHVIVLRRSTFDVFWSLVDRGEFRFLGGHTWFHWLDPRYNNRIVDPRPFVQEGEWGCALWYVSEMLVRAEYYKLLLAGRSFVQIHEVSLEHITDASGAVKLLGELGMLAPSAPVDIPSRTNQRERDRLPPGARARARELHDSWSCDSVTLARRYYDSGARLGDGIRR